ncbi:MAG: PIG-L deacetylase family protein [Actinomycetota bacterium]|nr:PIG-L deacetylase family protein [Actinomycetota bacterium]
MLRPPDLERLLVVMAHPDDVDFGSAGTMATMSALGVHITYCLVTDGDAGGSDRSLPRAEMAATRRVEQTAAAKVVGVHDLVFLGHPDGRVEANLQLRCDISRVIRQVRPQVVLCQSPERNLDRIYASHPDHLAAGEAALAAVYPDSRNPFAFPELLEEGLEPWTVPEVWLSAHPTMTDVVDVTEHFDRKIEALLCHESQHPDPAGMQLRVRQWMGGTAVANGLAEGRLAEGYRVVVTI